MIGETSMTKPSAQQLAREHGRMRGLAEHGFMGLDARGPGVPGMSREEAEIIARTIAGEIDHGDSPYGKPATDQEIAAILGVIDNRADLKRLTRNQVVHEESQFSTWNDAGRRNTAAQNFQKYGNQINKTMRSYFGGELKSPVPFADHYWSPKGIRAETKNKRSEPVWAPNIVNQTRIGPHTFGTRKDRIESARQVSGLRGVKIPAPTPRPLSPAEQAYVEYGRSRAAGPAVKTYGDLADQFGESGVRGFDGRGAPQPEPSGGGIIDWLDWIVPGGGRR